MIQTQATFLKNPFFKGYTVMVIFIYSSYYLLLSYRKIRSRVKRLWREDQAEKKCQGCFSVYCTFLISQGPMFLFFSSAEECKQVCWALRDFTRLFRQLTLLHCACHPGEWYIASSFSTGCWDCLGMGIGFNAHHGTSTSVREGLNSLLDSCFWVPSSPP